MIKKNTISRGYIVLAFFAWLSVFLYDWAGTYAAYTQQSVWLPIAIKSIASNAFLISVMLFFKLEIGSIQTLNFRELLWKTFLTAGASIFVITLIRLMLSVMELSNVENNDVLTNAFYNFNAAFTTIFLANAFYVFKRLVLYQRTKILQTVWKVFEYGCFFLCLLNFFNHEQVYSSWLWIASPFVLISFYFAFNVRWVAYLSFNHKLQGILLLALILAISVIFVEFHYEYNASRFTHVDISGNIFSIVLYVFVFLYCLVALLVLLFNLPTSSVFEQKFEEVLSFQKLSKTVKFEKEEHKIYDVLFDSCINIVLADAAWLEIVDEKGNVTNLLLKNIIRNDVHNFKTIFRKTGAKINTQAFNSKNLKKIPHASEIENLNFKSALVLPLYSTSERIGNLGLLKKVNDGFDKEIIEIINTYLAQASVSIHNSRLLNSAIENERYKAQLSVAKKVQKRLLPTYLEVPNFDVSVFYKSAEEVGGDYYDFVEIDNKLIVVIGDVSGKSTSAAFNMAQMKGVFHALATLNLSANEFISKANDALVPCLEKNSFITLQILIFDLDSRQVEMARAGHCPPIYCCATENTCDFVKSEGLGLGIIRNKSILPFIESKILTFTEGDTLLLYTDGVTEARNDQNQEFGYERLREIFCKNARFASKTIIDNIKSEIFDFTSGKQPDDDFTLLVIKNV